VEKRHSRNADEMWSTVKEEWDSIPKDIVKHLYMSIPIRLLGSVKFRKWIIIYLKKLVVIKSLDWNLTG